MLKKCYILSLSQLLKITPELKRYIWQKLKPKKIQNVNKVTTYKQVRFLIPMVGTIIVIINNHITIIQIHIGKNTIEDVLLNGSFGINNIIKQLRLRLGIPKPKLVPYSLRMADQITTKSMGLIKDLKIYVHDIPYLTTFIVLHNNVVDFSYFMLLGKPWLKDAKVAHG